MVSGFGVPVLKVSPVMITTIGIVVVIAILTIVVIVKIKSSDGRKRSTRRSSGDKQVVVHHRTNGQVATTLLEPDTDPDLIQVKYGN